MQYCLEHFWNFPQIDQNSTKDQPFSFLFSCRNILKSTRRITKHLYKLLFYISQNSGSPNSCQLWKRRGPKHPEDPFNKILKILDMRSTSTRKHESNLVGWYQYLPENMKWNFGNMELLSSKNICRTSKV